MGWGIPGPREVLDTSDRSEAARRRVRQAIEDAIAVESPIHRDRLVKMVASAFDLSRVSANRGASIVGVVPRARYKGDEPGFFWDVSVGMDQSMEVPPGRQVVQQLQRCHLDHPVAKVRLQSGRLRIEQNVSTHARTSRMTLLSAFSDA